MSAPGLRNYRVSLVGHVVYGVWITAESRTAACEVARRMCRETRDAMSWQDGDFEQIEVGRGLRYRPTPGYFRD
jgi:hypothetical protein